MYIPRHQYWTWLLGMARGRRYARAIPPQAASVHLPVFQELLNLAQSPTPTLLCFPYGLPQSHPGFTRWLCAFHLGFSLVLQPQMVAWSVGAVLKIAMSSYGQRLCSQ